MKTLLAIFLLSGSLWGQTKRETTTRPTLTPTPAVGEKTPPLSQIYHYLSQPPKNPDDGGSCPAGYHHAEVVIPMLIDGISHLTLRGCLKDGVGITVANAAATEPGCANNTAEMQRELKDKR